MKAEIINGWPQGNSIRLLLTETSTAQVNSIRRALIADVPKLAITRVDFAQGINQDNSTGEVHESVNTLPDEVIAHRLAMIPIPTHPEEGIVFPEDCENCKDMVEKDKGCPSCQILYSLKVQGHPKDSDEEFKYVYASDLTVISDPMFGLMEEHQRIPLTLLSKGQYLQFYAFATLGRGRDHAKWSPVAAVAFRPQMKAILNKPGKKANVLFNLGLKTTDGKPIDAKLFGKDKTITDIDYIIDLQKAIHQVGAGTGRDGDFDDAITFEKIDNAFVFTFETDGSLTPVQAFNGAIKELKGRFENLSGEIERAIA
ncbi:MAG TPA: DNA-directed RNA polymerase subunit D [Candidatus Poseidoniales archaeon]|jgi:DNA-directed RNA polymerase subunit D|nr:MAG: DNA-directed RNA polymerase subunit D [Euryarchaeota archaeon]HIF90073.1 DNA-directed RNA polymerase subunit D [Candidatus Poseidoniales archaeon]